MHCFSLSTCLCIYVAYFHRTWSPRTLLQQVIYIHGTVWSNVLAEVEGCLQLMIPVSQSQLAELDSHVLHMTDLTMTN